MRESAVLDLDLSRVEERLRADAWRQWHAALFSPRLRLADEPDGPLEGYLQGMRLGAGHLVKVRAAFRRLHRSAASGPEGRKDLHTVIVQLNGHATLRGDGDDVNLNPGDIAFLPAARPFEQIMSDGVEMLLFLAPQNLVRARQPEAMRLANRRFRADDPGTRLLRGALLSAFESGPRLSESQRTTLLLSLIEMLGVPQDHAEDEGMEVRKDARIRDALAEMDRCLSDPDLDAARLAALLGISRRRLDELFVADLGKPVAASIWERRMGQAAVLLREQPGRAITEIALSLGYEDPAYFARMFKKRFGVTASAWRLGEGGGHVAQALGFNY